MSPAIVAAAAVALSSRYLLHLSWRNSLISGAVTGALTAYLRSKAAAPSAGATTGAAPIAPPPTSINPPPFNASGGAEGIAASGPGAIVPPGAVS